MDGESVAGSSTLDAVTDPALVVSDAGTLTASGDERKVLVCHKGADKLVPAEAMPDHIAHGDTLGSCSGTACPCFRADNIVAVEEKCKGTINATCAPGDPYLLSLQCDLGGTVPGTYNLYLAETAEWGRCLRDDVFARVEQIGLSASERQACVDILSATFWCQPPQ
jgi:hypothetical protein